MNSPNLFPIFLKAKGRRCLVVGGGAVAEEKIRGLLGAGMIPTVVSPEVTPTIAVWARELLIRWERRNFREDDLNGTFLIIAAQSQPSANALIYRAASAANVLCNAVDDPEHCDFYYSAVVRRGPLQIAISTSGLSPALAQRLRGELEERYPPEYTGWVEELGAIRGELKKLPMDAELRRWLLHLYADDSAFQRFLCESSAAVTPTLEDAS